MNPSSFKKNFDLSVPSLNGDATKKRPTKNRK